ncbi:hypothetical protein pdam_00006491, partial [Pocillopora damicornis]
MILAECLFSNRQCIVKQIGRLFIFVLVSAKAETLDVTGLAKSTRKYFLTVSSTVSIRWLSFSCCSNMIPDTNDSSLSVIPLSVMETSEVAPHTSPRLLMTAIIQN